MLNHKFLLTLGFICFLSGQARAETFPKVLNQLGQIVTLAHEAETWDNQEGIEQSIDTVFAQFRASPLESFHACNVLSLYKDSDLAIFENQISNGSNQFLSSCRSSLLKKLEAKYERDRQELKHQHPDVDPIGSLIDQIDCRGKIGDAPELPVAYEGGPAYGSYNVLKSLPRINHLPGLNPKEIVFTLDDGPYPGRTEKALAAFRQHCIKATFFIVGNMTERPHGMNTLKQILDEGHNIGNHTYSHPIFRSTDVAADDILEVQKNYDLLTKEMDELKRVEPRRSQEYRLTPFFRFPGGNETAPVRKYLTEHNWASFTWQAGANDWLPGRTAANVLDEALREIEAQKGGIFLLHDTHQWTVDMIPYLLSELTKRGYKIRHIVPSPDAV